jgi:hypothetical protein
MKIEEKDGRKILHVRECEPLLKRIQACGGGKLEVTHSGGHTLVDEVWLYDRNGRFIQIVTGQIHAPLIYHNAPKPKKSAHEKPGRHFKHKRIF